MIFESMDRLTNFILSVLYDRQFKVRFDSTIYDANKQDMGVWYEENGFQFSQDITYIMHAC